MSTYLSRPASSFEQSPVGSAQACLCDVEDRGLQTWKDGSSSYSVELSFQLSKRMKEGTGGRYLISRSYGQSLHPKSKLCAVVEALLGRPLTQTERIPGRFDLDELIGKNCIIEVFHDEKDGIVRAKIKDGALALLPGMVAFPVEGYTRKRDRDRIQADSAGPLGSSPETYVRERPPASAPQTASERLAQTERELLERTKAAGQVKTGGPALTFEEMKKRAQQAIDTPDEKLPF